MGLRNELIQDHSTCFLGPTERHECGLTLSRCQHQSVNHVFWKTWRCHGMRWRPSLYSHSGFKERMETELATIRFRHQGFSWLRSHGGDHGICKLDSRAGSTSIQVQPKNKAVESCIALVRRKNSLTRFRRHGMTTVGTYSPAEERSTCRPSRSRNRSTPTRFICRNCRHLSGTGSRLWCVIPSRHWN